MNSSKLDPELTSKSINSIIRPAENFIVFPMAADQWFSCLSLPSSCIIPNIPTSKTSHPPSTTNSHFPKGTAFPKGILVKFSPSNFISTWKGEMVYTRRHGKMCFGPMMRFLINFKAAFPIVKVECLKDKAPCWRACGEACILDIAGGNASRFSCKLFCTTLS